MLKLVLLKLARKVISSRLITLLFAELLHMKTAAWRSLPTSKNKPVVVILSLGSKGHSYSAVRAARRNGLTVLLVAKTPVLHEMIYTNYLIRLDPLEDTQAVIAKLRSLNVSGVAISIKHILLPAQVTISEALGCISAGDVSAYLCNNKFAWRAALSNAGIPQPKYSALRDDVIDLPVVQKPQTGTGSKGVAFLAPGAPARPELLPHEDRSVGQVLYFEEYVEGTQFDVEGVSHNGTHTVLCIIREKYSQIDDEFPPKYFRFNPDLASDLHDAIIASVFATLDASSIKNGAWHVEGRIRDGVFLPLDFANRMGYERFVSQASGVDFAALHLSAFVDDISTEVALKPSPLLQFFANTKEEQAYIRDICRTHPHNIFDIKLDPFRMSTVTYEAMIVLHAKDDAELAAIAGPLMNPLNHS
jgi:hypothetical protein